MSNRPAVRWIHTCALERNNQQCKSSFIAIVTLVCSKCTLSLISSGPRGLWFWALIRLYNVYRQKVHLIAVSIFNMLKRVLRFVWSFTPTWSVCGSPAAAEWYHAVWRPSVLFQFSSQKWLQLRPFTTQVLVLSAYVSLQVQPFNPPYSPLLVY